jgi:hypothetical protein
METIEGIETTQFIRILKRAHQKFFNGMHTTNAKIPRQWLQDHKLSLETGVVYNSGQIHHRKSQEFRDELQSIGLLTPSNVPTNAGQKAYRLFGSNSMMFPLRNEEKEVVNYYAVKMEKGTTSFLNKQGIYPFYPNPYIKKLYITNTVLEAASLMESGILKAGEAVIALFDGEFLSQHTKLLETLKEIEEIVVLDSKNKS